MCKLVITTRINKIFESDVFMPPILEEKEGGIFTKLYISKTYSQKDITFDYCFYGNTALLSSHPSLIPTKLFDKYPKHEEM